VLPARCKNASWAGHGVRWQAKRNTALELVDRAGLQKRRRRSALPAHSIGEPNLDQKSKRFWGPFGPFGPLESGRMGIGGG
jgi:hypothetical protein